MDSSHKTYELTFPAGLNLAAAARVFTALDGLLSPIHRGPLVIARRTVAFELLLSPTGVHHLMSVPDDIAEAVGKHLRGIMPMLRVTEIAHQPRRWLVAGELRLTQTEPEEAAKEAAKDAAYIPVLLNSLSGLAVDEAAMVQLIVTGGGQGRVLYHARVATTAPHQIRARQIMKALSNGFKSLHASIVRPVPAAIINRVSLRSAPIIEWRQAPVIESLALAYAMPIGTPQLGGMRYNRGLQLAPDHSISSDGARVAEANFHGAERPLALTPVGRAAHTLVVAPTDSGKSTLIENLIVDDIRNGRGLLYIDPKGDSARKVADLVPRERIRDVIYFDVSDLNYPIGLNLLTGGRSDRIAADLTDSFNKLYDLSNAHRAFDVLRSSLMCLAECGYTILDVLPFLEPGPRGQPFRDKVAAQLTKRPMLSFIAWYDNLSTREQAEVASTLERRLRPLHNHPELTATFGQSVSGFDIEEALHGQKIIVVPLNKGVIGKEAARVVATLVLNAVWNAARSVELKQNFHLYIDEFREMANVPVPYGEMFEQARGYKLPILAAVQDVERFGERERAELMNNARNMFFYRPAPRDARHLAREMGNGVTEEHLMSLGSRELMMRFQVDGVPSLPVTGHAYPPPTPVGLGKEVLAASRATYGRPMAEVEAEIERRYAGSRTTPRAVVPTPDKPSSPPPAPLPVAEETGWEPWDGSIES
ncbi:type IV secretory system conjugative DNA transfer family protein [Streptomyces sp. V1I1]|uniref:type IV secretory system conjugative DNA transfer family protein n=1 Tax=Streptomyces sp. V1I1 TaxID=3042272 RepID=UPI0027D884A8|nr:hypothetical protein [Streptomyces sp. V1I1]